MDGTLTRVVYGCALAHAEVPAFNRKENSGEGVSFVVRDEKNHAKYHSIKSPDKIYPGQYQKNKTIRTIFIAVQYQL